jgi:hypothetical protein
VKLDATQVAARQAILSHDKAEYYEEVPCLCGSTNDYTVLSEVERHGLPYKKVICASCALLRVTPRWKKEHYDSFYEHQYRGLYSHGSISKIENVKKLAGHSYVKDIGKWINDANLRFGSEKRNPKIVEIGAGGGWILHNVPSGWNRVGYDVDREYLNLGKELLGLEMKFGFQEEALVDVRSSDLILLSHVVEHFLDPIGALRQISGAMPASALLLIEVPGILRIHRSHINPMTYMQNAHTYTFCALTLKGVCESAGLKVLSINEDCRVICSKSGSPGKGISANEGLANVIISYLLKCEAFYKRFASLNDRRILRPLAYVSRKIFGARMNAFLAANKQWLHHQSPL